MPLSSPRGIEYCQIVGAAWQIAAKESKKEKKNMKNKQSWHSMWHWTHFGNFQPRYKAN